MLYGVPATTCVGIPVTFSVTAVVAGGRDDGLTMIPVCVPVIDGDRVGRGEGLCVLGVVVRRAQGHDDRERAATSGSRSLIGATTIVALERRRDRDAAWQRRVIGIGFGRARDDVVDRQGPGGVAGPADREVAGHAADVGVGLRRHDGDQREWEGDRDRAVDGRDGASLVVNLHGRGIRAGAGVCVGPRDVEPAPGMGDNRPRGEIAVAPVDRGPVVAERTTGVGVGEVRRHSVIGLSFGDGKGSAACASTARRQPSCCRSRWPGRRTDRSGRPRR